MHELGIAESAIRATLVEMDSRGAKKLIALKLRIGSMACVDPDALQFAFQAVTRSSGLEGAQLEVEIVEAVAFCKKCNYKFTTERGIFFACPKCRDYTSELLQGKEIELARIEME